MEYVIKKDIIRILRRALSAIKKNDTLELDELSNQTIHDASIFQDKDAIAIAVVVYSISKIMNRSESNPEYWEKVYKKIESDLEEARFFLEKGKEDKYRPVIKNILQNIGEVDDKLKLYIVDVLEKAKMVKGSKLYEHGVSIERAAELLGVSQWELMSYVGKTQIVDRYKEEVIPVSLRIEHAKKVFGL
jgi:hypothetical protein